MNEYLCKPTVDRKKLVLQHYEVRWEKDAKFRAVWPTERSELANALKEWANEQFIRPISALIESSPQGSKLSGGRVSTRSTPAPANGGQGEKANGSKEPGKGPMPQRYSARTAATRRSQNRQPAERALSSPGNRDGGFNQTFGSSSAKEGRVSKDARLSVSIKSDGSRTQRFELSGQPKGPNSPMFCESGRMNNSLDAPRL